MGPTSWNSPETNGRLRESAEEADKEMGQIQKAQRALQSRPEQSPCLRSNHRKAEPKQVAPPAKPAEGSPPVSSPAAGQPTVYWASPPAQPQLLARPL